MKLMDCSEEIMSMRLNECIIIWKTRKEKIKGLSFSMNLKNRKVMFWFLN